MPGRSAMESRTARGPWVSRSPVAEIPVAQVSTPVLPGTGHVFEVWRCNRPATSGQRQRVRFRRTADMLFGCIAVSEAQLAAAAARTDGVRRSRTGHAAGHGALHEATSQAYRESCAAVDAENYPHLLRVWNYLPDLNGYDDDTVGDLPL